MGGRPRTAAARRNRRRPSARGVRGGSAGELAALTVCRLAAGAGARRLERAAHDAREPEEVQPVETHIGSGVPAGAATAAQVKLARLESCP